MKEDEILYINHDEAELGSVSAAYIENKDKVEQLSEVVINSREEPEEATVAETEETVAPEAEEAATHEAEETPEKQEASVTGETQEEAETETSEAPEEPVEETTEESPTEPLDKIDQITNSASSLPLPSEETEDIDPLLPY